MNLLFKYPTRSRPTLFLATLTRYRQYLSGKHPHRFVISCDADDETMNNPEMRGWLAGLPDVEVHFNPPPQNKVTAINANVPADGWDLCVLASDDMIPLWKGYDDRIVTLFQRHFPDGDGVLHTNDGRTGRELNTLAIQDHKYLSRTGTIYPPHYESVYVDNEFQDVSQRLGRAVYVDETIIRHEWTDATGRDPLHRRNEDEKVYRADRAVYQRRKAAGFPSIADDEAATGTPELPRKVLDVLGRQG